MPIAVVPFAPEHLEPAAALLAARHRADQGRVSGLPSAFSDPAVALAALEALLGTPATDGWVAHADGRLAGFLIGKRQLFADSNLLAAFFDARAVMIPFAGYAADPEKADAVYRALYAPAAAQWVEAGFFSHSIRTTSDAAGVAPWFCFGFGQRLASGIRLLDDVPGATATPSLPAPFTARRAGPADGDAVHGVIADLVRFHANSPMFLPQLAEAIAAERGEIEDYLADPAIAYWVAEEAGEAVGVMGLHPAEAGWVDDGRRPDRSAYLFLGHMRAPARGRGIATALVESTLAWAREAGYAACIVDWFTTNPLSSRFWPRRGFVPFAARLERRIDPRVAWARA
jgi:GNAT superfamily N-acetyltransferase